jgi:hypothetical protein
MATKEEVQNIVINSYRKYLSDDEKWIVIGNAFIPVENVVDFVMLQKGDDDKYLHTSISMAIEYFSS